MTVKISIESCFECGYCEEQGDYTCGYPDKTDENDFKYPQIEIEIELIIPEWCPIHKELLKGERK